MGLTSYSCKFLQEKDSLILQRRKVKRIKTKNTKKLIHLITKKKLEYQTKITVVSCKPK